MRDTKLNQQTRSLLVYVPWKHFIILGNVMKYVSHDRMFILVKTLISSQ